MSQWIYGFIVTMLITSFGMGETLKVRHDHDPWGGCEGAYASAKTPLPTRRSMKQMRVTGEGAVTSSESGR